MLPEMQMSGKQQAKSQTKCTSNARETGSWFQLQLEILSLPNGQVIRSLRGFLPKSGMDFMISFFGMSCIEELQVFLVFLLDWYVKVSYQCYEFRLMMC